MAETGTSDGQRSVTLPGLVWFAVLLDQIRYLYKLPPESKGTPTYFTNGEKREALFIELEFEFEFYGRRQKLTFSPSCDHTTTQSQWALPTSLNAFVELTNRCHK